MNNKLTNLLLGLVDGLDNETENDPVKKIFILQKDSRDRLLEEVADISLKYDVVDNVLDIPIKERKKLKRKVSRLIDDLTESEYSNEKKIVTDLLKTNATERYLMNTYFYDKAFDIEVDYNLRRLSDNQISNIINHKVKVPDSEVWSDLTWRHKKTLNKQMRGEIYDLMDGKTNVNQISENISKRYKQTFNRSRTLVRTETTRVQAEVNEVWAKDNGIDEQMFTATLDDSTSEECSEEDGKVYDIDDSSKPVPPLHPNCRSTLVNVPYKDWKPSMRFDNITKKNINYQDYKEWSGN